MAVRTLAYRIGVDGQDAFVRAQKDMGDAADQQAARAQAAYDRLGAQIDALTARQQKAGIALAAAQPSPVAQQINAAVGLTGDTKSARDSAAVFAATLADDERKAQALKDAIDPLSKAQREFGVATDTANQLLQRGAITEAEHAAAIALAAKALADAEKAAKGAGSAFSFTSVQTQELGAVVHRTIDSLAAGINPMRVATMESARLGVALGSGPAGVSGIFALLTSSAALAAGEIAVIVGAMIAAEGAAIRYEGEQRKVAETLAKVPSSAGLTLAALDKIAAAEAATGQVSERMALDVESALAATGRVTAQQLPLATAQALALSHALGVDLPAATAELAKDISDPAKGIDDLNAKLKFLTAAEVEQVKRLDDQGQSVQAVNLLLKDLAERTQGATDKMPGLHGWVHQLHVDFDDAADSVGKFIAKLIGMPSADQTERLKNDLQQIAQLTKDNPVGNKDLIAHFEQDAAEARAAIARDKANADKATASQDSQRLKATFDALDPQLARIQTISDHITALQAALNKPKDLADAGLTRAQAEAAIAEGQREIKQLQDKEAGRNKHAESLAREAAAMGVSAQQALIAAEAYTKSAAAGELAEARRKALTDATKKGIDADAQAAREVALENAERVLTTAKQATALQDQATAQERVNALVADGKLDPSQAQAEIDHQLALVQADGVSVDIKGKLIAQIERENAARKQLAASQATAKLQADNDNAEDRIATLKLEAQHAGDLSGTYERLAAVLKVTQSPAFKASDDTRAQGEAIIQALAGADAQRAAQQAQFIAQTNRGITDQIELSQTELGLVGKSADEHALIVGHLQRVQALKAQGLDLSRADVQALIASGDAADVLALQLAHAAAEFAEFKDTGEKIIDDILNPQNWKNWGDAAKAVLDDIEQEFIKLALANPLKNALFHESLPTLSGFGGFFSGLFGGGGADPLAGLFADGTDDAPGGQALVGETGPEIVDLPPHARVIPANDTRKMLSGGGGSVDARTYVSIDARGAGPREVDVLSARLDRFEREFPGRVVATMNDARSRKRAI